VQKTLEKMADKLAPEKRHIFLHNGTFPFPLSPIFQFRFVFLQTNPFVDLGQKVFEWDQTLDEVNIYINLPPNVNSKQFYCKIQSKHIELGIKGNPPFLNVTLISFPFCFLPQFNIIVAHVFVIFVQFDSQHDLTSPVKTDSSFWTLGR
jgi:hypothetical protein